MSTMSELHRQQEEDRNELALTNPDDAKDAQADALRDDESTPINPDEAMHALKESRWEELESERACNQGHDCDFPLQEPDF
jgi:hypothetical protein